MVVRRTQKQEAGDWWEQRRPVLQREAPATHWASFPGLWLDRKKVGQTCTISTITLGESPKCGTWSSEDFGSNPYPSPAQPTACILALETNTSTPWLPILHAHCLGSSRLSHFAPDFAFFAPFQELPLKSPGSCLLFQFHLDFLTSSLP